MPRSSAAPLGPGAARGAVDPGAARSPPAPGTSSKSSARTTRSMPSPSSRQWWAAKTTTLPRPSSPPATSTRHSGRSRGSRSAASRPRARRSASGSPTGPASRARTWRAASRRSSSTQAGRPRASPVRRCRRRGIDRRRSATLGTRSSTRRAGPAAGPSRNSTFDVCPATTCDSRARIRASSGLSCCTLHRLRSPRRYRSRASRWVRGALRGAAAGIRRGSSGALPVALWSPYPLPAGSRFSSATTTNCSSRSVRAWACPGEPGRDGHQAAACPPGRVARPAAHGAPRSSGSIGPWSGRRNASERGHGEVVNTCGRCTERNPPSARFCSACGAALQRPSSRESRRTVTVLFCDLVGSTALGEQLDPEVLGELVRRYFERMSRALERHGATVEKFAGDAVMAVFGVPERNEDDALRALRAADEMRAELRRLNEELREEGGAPMQHRIGINTGEVVSGDPRLGQGLVLGDAVNVAARFEQHAAPGEVLLDPVTRELAGPQHPHRGRPAARGQGQVPAPAGVPAPRSRCGDRRRRRSWRARRSSGAPGSSTTCVAAFAAPSPTARRDGSSCVVRPASGRAGWSASSSKRSARPGWSAGGTCRTDSPPLARSATCSGPSRGSTATTTRRPSCGASPVCSAATPALPRWPRTWRPRPG